MEDLTPVLDAEAIYCTLDRFVCGQVRCAGVTALYTGRTISGSSVLPLSAAEVALWTAEDLGPITCQCGTLTARFDDAGALHVERDAR